MARAFLSAPGTENGPCLDCQHQDCEATRRHADNLCPYCGQQIGYQRWVRYTEKGIYHEECFFEEAA